MTERAWKLIETAPTDATPKLGFCTQTGNVVVMIWRDEESALLSPGWYMWAGGDLVPETERRWTNVGDEVVVGYRRCAPSHWMSLPDYRHLYYEAAIKTMSSINREQFESLKKWKESLEADEAQTLPLPLQPGDLIRNTLGSWEMVLEDLQPDVGCYKAMQLDRRRGWLLSEYEAIATLYRNGIKVWGD
jgi:hypothetical protein